MRYHLFHLRVKMRSKEIVPFLFSMRAVMVRATRIPKLNVCRQQRNSLICFEISAKREVREIRVPECYCQAFSRLLTSWHTKRAVSEAVLFGEGAGGKKEKIRLFRTPSDFEFSYSYFECLSIFFKKRPC